MPLTTQAQATPQRTPEPTRSRRHRRILPAIAAAIALVAVAAAVLVFVSSARNSHPTPGDVFPAATEGTVKLRQTPETTLAAAAAAISTTEAPRQQYSYVEAERWVHTAEGMRPLREKRWRAADGSGREVTASLPAVAHGMFRWSMIGKADFSQASISDTSQPTGGITPAIYGQPSTDPGGLRQQLHMIEPVTAGPAGVLRAVSALFYNECPTVGVRIAAMRVLATIEGLTINDLATDALGRPGIAVAVSTPASTDVLIINPRDGTMLSIRRSYTYQGSKTAIAEHAVLLACGQTPDTSTTPAT